MVLIHVRYDFTNGVSNLPGRPISLVIGNTTDSVFRGIRFVQSQFWTMAIKNAEDVLLDSIYINSTSSSRVSRAWSGFINSFTVCRLQHGTLMAWIHSFPIELRSETGLLLAAMTTSRSRPIRPIYSFRILSSMADWEWPLGETRIPFRAECHSLDFCRSIGQYIGVFERVSFSFFGKYSVLTYCLSDQIENVTAERVVCLGTRYAGYIKTWTGLQQNFPPNGSYDCFPEIPSLNTSFQAVAAD
jgi:hypothetical protein